ncbi:MAG: response regulator [Myxococcales bacterium]
MPARTLARTFSRRMLPLAALAGLVVAAAPPSSYRAVAWPKARVQAHLYATNVAAAMGRLVSQQPYLWRFNADKVLEATAGHRGQPDIRSVRITDCAGATLFEPSSGGGAADGLAGWAPILRAGETVGFVEVRVDTSAERSALGAIALFSALAGLAVGLLLYRYPTRVVREQAGVLESTLSRLRGAEVALTEANQALAGRVEEAVAEARRLSERVVSVQEEERRRIARDLHDSVGQNLTALKLELALVRGSGAGEPAHLHDAERCCDEAVREVRRVVHDLAPPELTAASLPEIFRAYTERFEVRTGTAASFKLVDSGRTSQEVASCLLRVLQEALTNVARHATASEVGVRLEARRVRRLARGVRRWRRLRPRGARHRGRAAGNPRALCAGRRQDGADELAGDRHQAQGEPAPASERFMSAQKTRVLLAEDHQVVREGLRALLSKTPGFEVVGEASDGLQAVELATRLAPEVVVMDLGLPGLSGADATRRLLKVCPQIQVVVLSMHDDAPTVDSALHAGARGYVLKGAGIEHLLDAIRTVLRGEVYLSPGVSEYVLQGYLSAQRAPTDPLTDREREILKLVAEGCTGRENRRAAWAEGQDRREPPGAHLREARCAHHRWARTVRAEGRPGALTGSSLLLSLFFFSAGGRIWVVPGLRARGIFAARASEARFPIQRRFRAVPGFHALHLCSPSFCGALRSLPARYGFSRPDGCPRLGSAWKPGTTHRRASDSLFQTVVPGVEAGHYPPARFGFSRPDGCPRRGSRTLPTGALRILSSRRLSPAWKPDTTHRRASDSLVQTVVPGVEAGHYPPARFGFSLPDGCPRRGSRTLPTGALRILSSRRLSPVWKPDTTHRHASDSLFQTVVPGRGSPALPCVDPSTHGPHRASTRLWRMQRRRTLPVDVSPSQGASCAGSKQFSTESGQSSPTKSPPPESLVERVAAALASVARRPLLTTQQKRRNTVVASRTPDAFAPSRPPRHPRKKTAGRRRRQAAR